METHTQIMQGGWISALYAALYSFSDWLVTDSSGHMSGLGILAGVGAVIVILVKLIEATLRAIIAYKKWKLSSDFEKAQRGLLPKIRDAVVTKPARLED